MSEVMAKIEKEIKEIRKDLDFIKKHMFDPDCLLDADDLQALKEYEAEKKAGSLVADKEVKKKLKL